MTTITATQRPLWARVLKPTTRRGRIGLAVGILVLAGALTAAALAYITRAEFEGGGSAGNFTARYLDPAALSAPSDKTFATPTTTMSGAGTCEASIVDGRLSLDVDRWLPGASCTIGARAYLKGATGDPAGKAKGIDLVGLPAGWKAELLAPSCETTVPVQAGTSANGSSTVAVSLRVTMTPAAAPNGETFAIGSGSGLRVVPSNASDAGATPCTMTVNGS